MERITIKGNHERMDACVNYLIGKFGNDGNFQIVRLTVGNVECPTVVVQARDRQTKLCAAVRFTLTTDGILVESDSALWYDIGQRCIGVSDWVFGSSNWNKTHYQEIAKTIFMEAISFFTVR